MDKHYEDEFRDLWTSAKDDYCLVKVAPIPGSRIGYLIKGTNQKTIVLIERGPVQEVIDNMIQAGVRIFDTNEEWEAFVESQPGYTTAKWWDEPGVKSPFIDPNNPPPSWARAKGDTEK